MISEKTIEAVVNHQFQSANEATHQCKSLEISGFGKFFFNEGKAIKTMQKYLSQKALFEKKANDETLPEAKRRTAGLKLQTALDNIRDLKPKVYDFSDLRGVEEQPTATQEVEENNKGDEQRKVGHL